MSAYSPRLPTNLKALGQKSLAAAAKEAAKLALEHDNLWAAYRGDKSQGEREIRDAGSALLKKYGLKPEDQIRAKNDRNLDAVIDAFRDAEIEPEREAYADGDEQVYGKAEPAEYLSPVKLEALRQLYGGKRFLASDALELYLSLEGTTLSSFRTLISR